MKYLRVTSISLFLGSSVLLGCGPREVAVEPTPSPQESEVSESGSSSTNKTAKAETDTTDAETDINATTINPPTLATLTAQQTDAQINVRSRPTTQSPSKGYGLVGDPIKLLRAAEGDEQLTWYYVKFDESGAEGWIRGDFIDTTGTTVSTPQEAGVSVDAFTTDELFAVDGGGCGMTLWPVGRSGEFVFFNGLPDTSMWMKLDGDMTQFRRTAVSGPEFYGQSASQRFISDDGLIEVNVRADVGAEKGYEAVNIDQGTLRLEASGGMTEITVEGDAGC